MQKTNWQSFLLLIILMTELSIPSAAQDSTAFIYSNISKITVFKPISSRVSSVFIDKITTAETAFPALEFNPGTPFNGAVPDKYVTKKLLLKFNIRNAADTTHKVYFFPGFYYQSIQLYKVTGSSLTKIPTILPKNPDSLGYRLLSLHPHDSATIIAELTFLKTYINTINPRLVNVNSIDSFIAELKSNHNKENIFTYLFCGLLLMMILFSMSNFFQGSSKEFLYYSAYAFFLGAMLLTKSLFYFRINPTSFFFESYFDFILMNVGIIFYMFFMQLFIDSKNKHPFLYKLYDVGILLLLIAIIGFTYFHYFTDYYSIENLIEIITKFFLLIMIVIFLIYSLNHWKDKLLRYLFWGNLCLLTFSIISFSTVLFASYLPNNNSLFNSSLFYYEIGLFLELVFFLSALNYKNYKRIIAQTQERESFKAQNKLVEYEKEIAIYKAQQEERQRISADMHDELGSGMTAIRLMSEIAKNKMKENTPIEIDKISSSADDVLNKMNAIIWSMNIGNDTLDNLISYIRAYAIDYFDNTPIQCKVKVSETIPLTELTGDKRRNIFLSLKETLNNVLKHSKASLVNINIDTNDSLIIQVTDNGEGIDKEKIRQFGNGLKNIAKRMESIGGAFIIENNNGTVTTLTLPL